MEINLKKSKAWFSQIVDERINDLFQNTLQIKKSNDLGMYLGYP